MGTRSLVLLVALASALPARAGATDRATRKITIPDLSADEKALIADARDDQLDHFDTVTGSLVASALPESDRRAAAAKWATVLASWKTQLASLDEEARGKELLRRLFTDVLHDGDYAFEQNDVGVALLAGRYNCVTSAILYQAGATALGLDAVAVMVPSHVYVRVTIGRATWDVETTQPNGGFGKDRDDTEYAAFLRKMQLSTEQKTGRKIVQPDTAFSRRETDAIGLIGLLYTNLAGFAAEGGDISRAALLFSRAALLAQDASYARDARDELIEQIADRRLDAGNLVGARNALSFALSDPGGDPKIVGTLKEQMGYAWGLEASADLAKDDFPAAITALQEGMKWSTDPGLDHNLRAAIGNWGYRELTAKRYESAARILSRGHERFPDQTEYVRNLKATYSQWTDADVPAHCADALDHARALRLVLPGDPDANQIFWQTASGCGDAKASKKDWAGAAAIWESANKEVPSPVLAAKSAAAWNNAGVALASAGKKGDATDAFQRALSLDPSNQAARDNLEHARR